MEVKEFEKIVKKLDHKKYHICRKIKFNSDGVMYVDSWDIFRKDMSLEEYYSPENKPVLCSLVNDIDDIKKLIKEEKNGSR